MPGRQELGSIQHRGFAFLDHVFRAAQAAAGQPTTWPTVVNDNGTFPGQGIRGLLLFRVRNRDPGQSSDEHATELAYGVCAIVAPS